MAISTTSFIFRDICSEDFNLYLGEIGGSNGVKNYQASTNTEYIMDTIPNRNETFIYRTQITEPNLKIPVKLFSLGEIDRDDLDYIDAWLFANRTPQKLVFCQGDMANYNFMAIFSKNESVSVGNLSRGLECEIVCDSPYAYDISDYIEYINDGNIKYFECLSSGLNPLYPSIEFVCNSDNGTVKIKNIDDDNREFIITGLFNGEKITIDKWLQLVSSTGLRRLGNCNKAWLRFYRGVNRLEISGNVNKVKIGYKFLKGIGA